LVELGRAKLVEGEVAVGSPWRYVVNKAIRVKVESKRSNVASTVILRRQALPKQVESEGNGKVRSKGRQAVSR